jgi:hypothetical protein
MEKIRKITLKKIKIKLLQRISSTKINNRENEKDHNFMAKHNHRGTTFRHKKHRSLDFLMIKFRIIVKLKSVKSKGKLGLNFIPKASLCLKIKRAKGLTMQFSRPNKFRFTKIRPEI